MKKNSQQRKSKQPPAPARAKKTVKDYSAWLIGIALLLTLVAYMPAFKAGFVNWDDDDYVVNNRMITSFANTKEMISKPGQEN